MASNIEQFDDLVGRIFGELYESFPLTRHIFCSELQKHIAASNLSEVDDYDPCSDESRFFMASIKWLGNAGFIEHGLISQGSALDCVLTAKGLEALKATPTCLEGSLGDRLLKAAEAGHISELRELTGKALSYGVSLATTGAVK
ncbi:hypothetical protein IQ22_04503 [Pseudomonas duriflava]|uniref:Uncharacterized protein n=1 Tax=Pseudomonas duriflava TaxID=459528 RepID=A0A562PPQ8_9PSED|nr:hypothetical protein [Pseudomonas duriflava]TWI46313.1 hypothetical protein IQ22_04503 [Pseudomonas duriflava]